MQARATVIKFLANYKPDEIARHFAWELTQQSLHMKTMGAPKRAAYLAAQATVFAEAAGRLVEVEEKTKP